MIEVIRGLMVNQTNYALGLIFFSSSMISVPSFQGLVSFLSLDVGLSMTRLL